MENKIIEYKNKLFKEELTDDQFYSQLIGYKQGLKDSEDEINKLKKQLIELSHHAMSLAEANALILNEQRKKEVLEDNVSMLHKHAEKIDSETHEVDIAPPIGKFVTDNLPIEKRVVTANGMYIHFTDVCSLIKKFSVLKN